MLYLNQKLMYRIMEYSRRHNLYAAIIKSLHESFITHMFAISIETDPVWPKYKGKFVTVCMMIMFFLDHINAFNPACCFYKMG